MASVPQPHADNPDQHSDDSPHVASVWATSLLLDMVITSADGDHVGMVDDLEFTDPAGAQTPTLTALLCGPAALGPRLGGRIGRWWTSIGTRMRRSDDDYPRRIPVDWVSRVGASGVELSVPSDQVPTQQLEYWLRDHIVMQIPGHGGEQQ
jgi:sporulation protein YlmC with PRC-barrel domain